MFDKIMIGKNIELIIKRWGMKQQGFADLFPNMNRFKVSSYVNGTSRPSVEFMIILKRLTGLEIELLYLGELEPAEIPPSPLAANVFEELTNKYQKEYRAPQTLPELFERVTNMEKVMEKMKRDIEVLQEK